MGITSTSVKSKLPERLPPNKSRFLLKYNESALFCVSQSVWARGRKITTPPKKEKWQIDEKPNWSQDELLVFSALY